MFSRIQILSIHIPASHPDLQYLSAYRASLFDFPLKKKKKANKLGHVALCSAAQEPLLPSVTDMA